MQWNDVQESESNLHLAIHVLEMAKITDNCTTARISFHVVLYLIWMQINVGDNNTHILIDAITYIGFFHTNNGNA